MEKPPAPPLARIAAFSVTELLIVIALGAALLAFLSPAFQWTTRRGKDALCLQNLKSFGTGIAMYVAENGEIPPYKDWTTGKGIWRTLIAPYQPVTLKGDSCPAAEKPFSGRYDVGNFYAHYGWSVPANEQSRFLRLSTFEKPAERFQLGDTSNGGWYIIPKTRSQLLTPAIDTFAFRHRGYAHLLFNDGHIEARRPEEIPTRESIATPTYRAFWLGRAN